MGRWKIRKREPVVLVRAILARTATVMNLVRFEPSGRASAAAAKAGR
jgi:hypothetical protein